MPATKRKLPMKTLFDDSSRQPIKESEDAVKVVAKAPIVRAVYNGQRAHNKVPNILGFLAVA